MFAVRPDNEALATRVSQPEIEIKTPLFLDMFSLVT